MEGTQTMQELDWVTERSLERATWQRLDRGCAQVDMDLLATEMIGAVVALTLRNQEETRMDPQEVSTRGSLGWPPVQSGVLRVPLRKRHEYWNHCVARMLTEGLCPDQVNGRRIAEVKLRILRDDEFWEQVVRRHGGIERAPEEMDESDPAAYAHCFSTFACMLRERMCLWEVIR